MTICVSWSPNFYHRQPYCILLHNLYKPFYWYWKESNVYLCPRAVLKTYMKYPKMTVQKHVNHNFCNFYVYLNTFFFYIWSKNIDLCFFFQQTLLGFWGIPFPVVCYTGLSACKWSAKAKILKFPPEGVPLLLPPKRLHWTPLFTFITKWRHSCFDYMLFLYWHNKRENRIDCGRLICDPFVLSFYQYSFT